MSNSIHGLIGDTDIYLLDQIMKGRYNVNDKILDAGCGNGRNLHWFLFNNMSVYGIDSNAGFINDLKTRHTNLNSDNYRLRLLKACLLKAISSIILFAVQYYILQTALLTLKT